MECNKDEATRAKEIAENKFKMKDIAGAKKFALKAQNLYPEIEGVSQMLATLDVYIAAENKVNEDVDWYGILNASPRDDDETLKRKYRKLALMLHPDKNKSIGAEGAFKHVSEAWKFLSDKEKRAAYDRRKSLHSVYQKVSVSSSNNGFCNFAKTTFTTNARTTTPRNNPPAQKTNPPAQKTNPPAQKTNPPAQKNNPPTQKNNPQKPVGTTQKTGRTDNHTTTPNSFTASGSSDQSKSNTFWTVCRRCMMQYEYLRVYVNCNLRCPNCLQSYLAVEVPKPGISSRWSSCSRLKSAANHNTTSGLFNNSKWTFSRTSSAAHAASVVQHAYEKVKKDREQAKATARREKKNAKRKSTTDSSASGSSLKKRKVCLETDIGCSSGREVTYRVTGENGKNMGKLEHGTKESADKLSLRRTQRKISKENVTREVKSR
ncbi:unnamed protein product [Arabidopsis thaliana]|jgi:curved DNA-binding protein CbpA|uniref:AT5g37380/MNJ8_170 n=2 Tax=Arabidopsis TaxID=3701 RepID=Q9FHS7_ARATH|nr:Chaperone DnaJ-domain superfamily protein [Arabidopsis thaliana]NP_001119323.1 Chaperone DnaJ-domain superfamily protein [Arabidopsis thaliana]NP_001119324.1 Chaperone DnaJ-domain superfamily protein [Arabidopsis thaliana]NP_001318687.1 Chaperone DnaJ-domain superfamily protein [Arabidopsis thaliana]NP_001332210.1 Chaperone DnaJ-domain superfamily protein [Arabidopsis thaliana]NP_001332211.1 Chaperone DnaJ-domain superfamily protein [Arabidopsis thaliana]NP_001332212.1 Chaperone DnaJ-domai|eukprot:NP_001078673.1 Chaperone DnaJ-domain superfamily protein [Arabidopsis thaliana]